MTLVVVPGSIAGKWETDVSSFAQGVLRGIGATNLDVESKAITYVHPLLPRLGRYVNDERFCIDNNLVENAVRPLPLGRKNFLFCGNHDAAVRAVIVYSLVSSCKVMGVDPREMDGRRDALYPWERE